MKFRVAAFAAFFLVAAGVITPAVAGNSPAKVGRVTIVEGSGTSLTLRWPDAAGASEYLVERAGDIGMTTRSALRETTGNSMTVGGLRPGALYCFQVRAVNGSGMGERSQKSCMTTPTDTTNTSGARYRVLTYNICSVACGSWNARRADAADMIRDAAPDVVGLQEAPRDNGLAQAVGGFTQVYAHSGKALLYRTARFSVARTGSGSPRTGAIDLGFDPRHNKHRWAVWAELLDKQHNNKRVLFVTTHFSPGGDTARDDEFRGGDARALVAGVDRINPDNRPEVLFGDLNSSFSRVYDTPGRVLRGAGYGDAFYLADRWQRPNHTSANKHRAEPTLGVPWGRHIDQVWVDPDRSAVLLWRNAASIVDGKYFPLVSNHSPILVEIAVN